MFRVYTIEIGDLGFYFQGKHAVVDLRAQAQNLIGHGQAFLI